MLHYNITIKSEGNARDILLPMITRFFIAQIAHAI